VATRHWLRLNKADAKVKELGLAGQGGSKAFAKAVKKYEKLKARCLKDLPQLAANGLARDHPGGIEQEEAARAARAEIDRQLARLAPERSQEARDALAQSLTEKALAKGKRVDGRYEFKARLP
jgi:hypothetical protein